MTAMTSNHWTPSPAQVEFVKNLFVKKIADSNPTRQQYWDNIRAVSTNEGLTTVINHLKSLPDLRRPLSDPPGRQFLLGNGEIKAPTLTREDMAKTPGLYRDPEDGTLYRLHTDRAISVYSNKAVYRRLTPEGQMVKKGKWTRQTAYQTRLMLSPYTHGKHLLAAWLMTDEDKQEWAVGFCLFCSKPLIDAVSVFNSVGPKCAETYHIHRQTPPEALAAKIEKLVLAK